MAYISVFDMLKIGIGPSSSHTLGPWRASEKFIQTLKKKHFFQQVEKLKITLYGSLSLTGKGHATDISIILGLCGFKPETIPTKSISSAIQSVKTNQILNLNNEHSINFNPEKDIEFSKDFLPFHSNALRFTAILQNKSAISEVYYSIGGGFIVQEEVPKEEAQGEALSDKTSPKVPFEISTGKDLEKYISQHPSYKISDFAMQNELALGRSEEEVKRDLLKIWDVMSSSIFEGATTEGFLTGGLNLKRRSSELCKNIIGVNFSSKDKFFETIKKKSCSFTEILDFVSIFAMAVNEVNASLGRVVTAPTNGSAGVIPAVLAYYLCIVNKNAGEEEIVKFLLNAGLIGGIFKNGATISAAAGGCQAEIGVSASMASSALTELYGGSVKLSMLASEIAMEHHLGLTCDPVNGLVQIPCIERNSMGAIKAINACNLALKTNPDEAKIPLDGVIKAMKETANDMDVKYKETSLGGLAKVKIN
jgi:L-serine dehydratase